MAEEIRANSYCGGGRWGYIFKELRDLGGNDSWFGNVNLWKSTQASIQECCQNRGRHNWADAHQEGSLKTWKFGGIWGGLSEIMFFASFHYLQMVRVKSLENELAVGR